MLRLLDPTIDPWEKAIKRISHKCGLMRLKKDITRLRCKVPVIILKYLVQVETIWRAVLWDRSTHLQMAWAVVPPKGKVCIQTNLTN